MDFIENKYDNYFKEEVSYNTVEIDSVVTFFLKRGFDKISAVNMAMIIIKQASRDNLPPYQLLDTLKGINSVQLTQLITEILNYNRPKTSKLGYKIIRKTGLIEQRNIIV